MQKEISFIKYVSNTSSGTSNNYILKLDAPKTITSRIYYKVNEYGQFNYKFLFSNTVDSTFSDGAVAFSNLKGDEYEIISAFAGDGGEFEIDFDNTVLSPILFNNNKSKKVASGELFWSDTCKLTIPQNHYLVFEWTVIGNNLPYTPDKMTPSFVLDNDKFITNTDFPSPHLVACDRKVKKRIAFLGDSITQGLGTDFAEYNFWVAEISKLLGNDYSVWNLGLGFARAEDAATNGVWLYKAKQMDLVSVCFGVNDIEQGRSSLQICTDLKTIITTLKKSGCEVLIFTIPPFSFTGEKEIIWRYVNEYIKTVLIKEVKDVFDVIPIIGKDKPDDNMAKYGEHPNATGGLAIAKEFIKQITI
ncbi:MAG: SGNH/GDSL hydrolase family protein [Clostridia bacterium]